MALGNPRRQTCVVLDENTMKDAIAVWDTVVVRFDAPLCCETGLPNLRPHDGVPQMVRADPCCLTWPRHAPVSRPRCSMNSLNRSRSLCTRNDTAPKASPTLSTTP